MMIDKHTLALVQHSGLVQLTCSARYTSHTISWAGNTDPCGLSPEESPTARLRSRYGLALGPVFGLASGVAHGMDTRLGVFTRFEARTEAGILV